jgi:3-oxoacyl-[acyl-carrier protein] reductase
MDLRLKGRTALVNGASQGIGYAIAHLLAEEGARVAVGARREPTLLAAAERIRSETGGEVVAIQGDIRRAEDCERLVATTVRELGELEILINNDGAPPLGPILAFDDEAWRKALDQNLMSVVRLSRAAVPHMRKLGGGAIVCNTALSVLQPLPGFSLSVASWAGVIGYVKTLSLEVAADNISVNTICPGIIETPRLKLVQSQSAELRDMTAEIPMKRAGDPEEIAALVALLVSPRGRYITGSTIHIDGGAARSLC